jgi:hypothetical protein
LKKSDFFTRGEKSDFSKKSDFFTRGEKSDFSKKSDFFTRGEKSVAILNATPDLSSFILTCFCG